jgi:hypothetical protein
MVSPTEPATPLVVRVVRDAPEAVALLVGAWLLAEAVGGLALRRVAMRRPGHADAPFGAWRAIGRAADGVTRLRGFATLVVVDLVVLVAIVPGWVAAARSWGAVRILLGDGGSFEELAAGLALLVGSWLGGLCLLGVTLAWRATVWSVEAARATTAAD